jgi:cell shape-determining protein MreC/LysM repeat protein
VVIQRAPEPGESAAEAEAKNLRAENQRLANDLATARRSAERLTADLAAKNQQLETRAGEHHEANIALAAANTHLSENQRDDAALRDQLAAAKSAPAAPSPELTAKLAEAENKLATTLRSFSQLQAENEKLKAGAAESQRLGDELKNLRDEKASLEARLAAPPPAPSPDLAAKLAETENKLATTLRSFTQLQAENERFKASAAEADRLGDELKTLRDEKTALETRLAAASPSEPSPETAAKLAEAESKLATTLRSFSLLQTENDRLTAEAANAAANAQATAAKSTTDSAAQISALFDDLRPTKAQVTVLAAENAQLKTHLALAGPPPGTTLASPSRPGSVAPVEVSASKPEPPASSRQHVVAPGDTLAKISRQYYGTPNRWEQIQRANADIVKSENALPIGATLRIP